MKILVGIFLGLAFAIAGDLIWTIRDYQRGMFYE